MYDAPAFMFTVVITEKTGGQKRLSFGKPEVTIGRVQGNDVMLPKGNVSKRHSRIVLKDGRFIIVDLKSTNGTYVNGRKITSPLVVKEGDKIYIGDFVLTLEGDVSASGSMRPPASRPDLQLGGPAPGSRDIRRCLPAQSRPRADGRRRHPHGLARQLTEPGARPGLAYQRAPSALRDASGGAARPEHPARHRRPRHGERAPPNRRHRRAFDSPRRRSL